MTWIAIYNYNNTQFQTSHSQEGKNKTRNPCACAQCCVLTIFNTLLTPKQVNRRLTSGTSNNEFIHTLIITTPYRAYPGTRAALEAPWAEGPTYQKGRQLQRTQILGFLPPARAQSSLNLVFKWLVSFPLDLGRLLPYITHTTHTVYMTTDNSKYMEFHAMGMTSLVLKWAFVVERNVYEISVQGLTTIQQATLRVSQGEMCLNKSEES